MKLKIKVVEAIDIGPIRKMVEKFWAEMGRDYPTLDADEFDRMMMHILSHLGNPNFIFLLALDGKKPVGFFMGYVGEHEWGSPKKVGVAQELYVVPGKRNGFVGFRLIQKCVELALQQGVESFECVGGYGTTDKRWERFGFKPHLTYGHCSKADMLKIVGDKSEYHQEDRYSN